MAVKVPVPANVEGILEDVARITGGGAPPAEASATNTASAEPTFGVFHFDSTLTDSAGIPYTLAGGHPFQFTTEFNFGTYSCASPGENSSWQWSGTCPMHDPKDITSDLPPGLVANPQGVPHCLLADYFAEECERNKVAVGSAGIRFFGWTEGASRIISPVFNLQPQGSYPGELGITIGGAPFIVITTGVRSGSDYGVTAVERSRRGRRQPCAPHHSGAFPPTKATTPCAVKNARVVITNCTNTSLPPRLDIQECEEMEGTEGGGGPAEVPRTPFLTMPTECSGEATSNRRALRRLGCPRRIRRNALSICRPSTAATSSASSRRSKRGRPPTWPTPLRGLEFNLHVPQNEDPEGVATPELKEAVVKLPAGLSLNPASG